MPVETRESIEAQGGVWFATFSWPLAFDEQDKYWSFKAKEPHIRHGQHVGNRVDVYSLPTKSAWLPVGFPVIIRRQFDRAMTQAEVDDYREAMYGVRDKPPVRPAKAPGTAAKKQRKRNKKRETVK